MFPFTFCLSCSISGLLLVGGPIEADAGGVMSIESACEKVVDVVDDGRIGICREPAKFVSCRKGL